MAEIKVFDKFEDGETCVAANDDELFGPLASLIRAKDDDDARQRLYCF